MKHCWLNKAYRIIKIYDDYIYEITKITIFLNLSNKNCDNFTKNLNSVGTIAAKIPLWYPDDLRFLLDFTLGMFVAVVNEDPYYCPRILHLDGSHFCLENFGGIGN